MYFKSFSTSPDTCTTRLVPALHSLLIWWSLLSACRGPSIETTPEFEVVSIYIAEHAAKRTYRPGVTWPKYSEEWYWDVLLGRKPFRSVYEDQGLRQPLIQTISENLSQTPREQCELQGYVTEGLDREGPGQAVEIHGLQARSDLNGRRGRVLPSNGRGAPPTQPAAGRIAVRLQPDAGQTPEVISVKPGNIRSPYAAGPGSGPAAGSSAGGRPKQLCQQMRQQQQQQQQQAPPGDQQQVLQVLEEEFKLWKSGSTLSPASLQQAGMRPGLIRCGQCERQPPQADRFVALKRGVQLRPTPVPQTALQLLCLNCFAMLAQDVRMPLTAAGAEKFCDTYMMGPMEACMIIQGMPMAQWGSASDVYGQMY